MFKEYIIEVIIALFTLKIFFNMTFIFLQTC